MSRSPYEQIKEAGVLPSPKGVALKLIQMTIEDDRVTIEEIVALVESDPSLASQMLKLINSPMSGMPRRVASIGQAVALLGLVTVKATALSHSLMGQNHSGRCAGFDYDGFWSGSVARAAAARNLASRHTSIGSDEAFTCGLLGQIGRLAFATTYPETYDHLLGEHALEGGSLCDLERDAFDIDHNELAAAMMEDWQLPTLYCDAVRNQDEKCDKTFDECEKMEQLGMLLGVAGSMAFVLIGEHVGSDDLSALTRKGFRLGLSPDALHESFDAVRCEWQELGKVLSVTTRSVAPLIELFGNSTRAVAASRR